MHSRTLLRLLQQRWQGCEGLPPLPRRSDCRSKHVKADKDASANDDEEAASEADAQVGRLLLLCQGWKR